MDAAVQIRGKKAVKVLGAACLATGVVVLSAVVASIKKYLKRKGE